MYWYEHDVLLSFYRSFSRNQRNRGVWNTMGNLASNGNAHLYAFVTSNKGAVMGGWAGVGKLCNPRKSERTSISRYSKGRVTWTSEVLNFFSFNTVTKNYIWIYFFISYIIFRFLFDSWLLMNWDTTLGCTMISTEAHHKCDETKVEKLAMDTWTTNKTQIIGLLAAWSFSLTKTSLVSKR